MKLLGSLIQRYTENNTFQIAVYVLIALVVSVFQYSISFVHPDANGYTKYNNYIIFRQSFEHLIQHKDLYVLYLDECWDLYKYSPAFALSMFFFDWMPDVMGLSIWNILNSVFLILGIQQMNLLSPKVRNQIGWFVLPELIISLQNAQSNGLIAGWLILGFNALEIKKILQAAALLMGTVFIKLFGIMACCLLLLYTTRWKAIGYCILITILLIIIPIIVISPSELWEQYRSWGRMLSEDHTASDGLSILGWLHTWFGIEPAKILVVGFGGLMMLLPLLRFSEYVNPSFRLLFFSNLLIGMVILNHKAESPTFIIAICGCAIWFWGRANRNWVDVFLLVSAFILASLSPTDIFPQYVRSQWVIPYVLKAVPCIFIWLKINYELLSYKDLK